MISQFHRKLTWHGQVTAWLLPPADVPCDLLCSDIALNALDAASSPLHCEVPGSTLIDQRGHQTTGRLIMPLTAIWLTRHRGESD